MVMAQECVKLQASLDECQAALPAILAAPKHSAPIDQLCFRTNIGMRAFVDQIDLSVTHGIKGDRWLTNPWLTLDDGRPDPRIQISVLQKQVMDLCWRDRENTPHPGDPLVVDMDLSEQNLPAGTRLIAGSAELEVSDYFNSGCKKWSDHYGHQSLKWINLPENRKYRLRGMLCKIVKDGTIHAGDTLSRSQ